MNDLEVLDVDHPAHFANNEDKGWAPQPEVAEAYAQTLPSMQMMCGELRSIEDNKPIVLTKVFEDTIGKRVPFGPQGIGDCVSWGNAGGLNVHQAVMIATGRATYSYDEACTESIYALARCEVGKQWNSYKDGAVGAWAAKSMTLFGCLGRSTAGIYSPKRAKDWGAKGLPDNLEPEAKLHIYKNAVLVTSWDQAVPLIQAGYPVVVCSNVGFNKKGSRQVGSRDQDGFCAPNGTWYHCMFFAGVRFDREGLLCLQSWGSDVPSGQQVLEQPPNSFWVEKSTVSRMLSQRDTYCHDGAFTGFKPNDAILDWTF